MDTTAPTFVRTRPGRLLRLFFKMPARLYRGWLAELFRRRCILLLTTRGRRSGLPRRTCVSFLPADGRYVIFSGWGIRADWYQNLLAHPEVVVQVGRCRFRATARPVLDASRRRELMLEMRDRSTRCGPPRFIRSILRLAGVFDYDREIALAVAHAGELPVVEIVPAGAPAPPQDAPAAGTA